MRKYIFIVLLVPLVTIFNYVTDAAAATTVGGVITSNTTWTLANSPYTVTSTVQIYGTATTPATLTIEPGVVVKFNSGTGIQIGNGTNQGSIVASGTTTNRIAFTRSAVSGTWAGITFNDKTVDATAILENVDIQYSSDIYITSASPIIKNSTIKDIVGSYGIYLSTANPVLENVTITTNSTYGIYLNSSSPIITGGSLTNTNASGSGIYGNGSPTISNYNVTIANSVGKYGLYLTSATSELSVIDSTIGNGLYLGAGGFVPSITGNTFTNSDNSPPHAGANIIAQILDTNNFNGLTTAGRIEVVGEQINRDAWWKKLAAPYVVLGGFSVYRDTTASATLTIDPGVTVKFAAGTGIYIGSGASQGALVAKGTISNRIVFTRSATSGTWGGLTFYDGTVDSSTSVEYADIQYSSGISINSASPAFRNSTITDVTGYISLNSSNSIFDAVTITNNGSYGIYLGSSSPIITGGSLTNINATGHGIYGSGSPVISNYNVAIVNSAGKYGLYLSGASSALSVTNSTIGNGLYLGAGGFIPTITGNTFTNSDNSPPHAGANITGQILDTNTFDGLTSAGKIEVVGEQINRDVRWKTLAAPYIVTSSVQVYGTSATPVTLTIDPGVTIKFAAGAGFTISNGATYPGSLIAKGTSSSRITFTRNAASGNWGNIYFQVGTLATAAIEYADIQYSADVYIYSASPSIKNSTIKDIVGSYGIYLSTANPVLENVTITTNSTYGMYIGSSSPIISGGSLTNSNTSGYGIYGSGSPAISNYNVSIVNGAGRYGLYLTTVTSALSVTNSTIANGLYLGSTGIIPTITGNTFSNSDNSPPHAGVNIIAQILATNTFNDLTLAGKIEVVGEQVNQDALWRKLVAPYVVVSGTISVYKDATTPATLTIEPGTVVKFASGSGLQIANGTSKGAIIARGTTTNRITFTRNAASGNWGGITFNDGTVDATTIIENADIQYSAGVVMSSASPIIKNLTLTNVTGYGLNLSTSSPTIDTVTITNDGSYGIYLNSSSPTITSGSLTNANASGYGIYGSGSPIISNYNVAIVNGAGRYGLYLTISTSALSVTNSTIGNGLYLGSTGITPTISGNTFINSDNSPLHAGANIIASILTSNTLTGLTSAGRIEIVGEQVKQDVTWSKLAASYWVVSGTVSVYKDATSAATLIIDSGAVVKFASGSGLQIGNGTSKGSLIARGTPTDRITFTRSATSGTWAGITYNDGTVDSTSILENADIQYSTGVNITSASPVIRNSTITDVTGYGLNLSSSNPTIDTVTITNNGTYGIYLSSSSPIITGGSLTNSSTSGYGIYGSGSPVISSYNVSIVNSVGKYGLYLTSASSTLSVTNSTIGNGLYLGAGGFIPTITGNTFSNSDNSPPHAGAIIIGQILDSNTFDGLTSAGKIEVVAEQINRDVRWKKFAAPYVVLGSLYIYKDTTSPATLTIDPGVTVKCSLYTALYIGSGATKGVLVANGTAALPITFTSSQATPSAGNWYGLNFSGGAASSSVLNSIIVEYGGYGGAYNSANISLSSSSPTISSATIRNSAGSGIYLSSATVIPIILDSAITANKWGIYADNSNPLINNSKIFGNSTAGVWNSSTTVEIDARGNWWGAASGPAHASNPSGTGNAVSNKVLFNPWLGQPPSLLNITNVRITPAAFNPVGDSVTISATLSASATWKITISDSTALEVTTFTGSGTTINQVWSGENSANVKVVDGTYNVTIEATDTNSNIATPVIGTIKVSRLIPIAIINSPADNLMYQGGTTIDIYATANDTTDFKNYTLEYGIGEAPVSWSAFIGATTTQPNNEKIYSWNTSGYTGGIYSLRLTATDNTGNTQTKTVRVRLLWISTNAQTENYISPNNDGIKDSTIISATSTHPADWSIAVSNSSNMVVSTLTSANSATLSQVWDGKDNSGTVVPDGTYTYTIIATDPISSVQSAPKTGTVISDITAPSVSITSPAPGGLLRNSVTVTGTASDANIASYSQDFGPSDGNGPWTFINSATSSVSSATLGTWITNDQSGTVPLANGSYLLRLVASDKAGNSAGFMIPVTADNLILSSITASSRTINTAVAETSSVSFSINVPATVNFKIIPEKQGANGTPVYQSSIIMTAAGSSSFTWDGKDSAATVVSDEAYLYVLNATDGTRTDSYAPPVPSGTGSATCTQGSYYPRRNVPLTISYSVAQPERVTINISWGSKNFKIMDAIPHVTGSYTFIWDGRDPNNIILDGGGVAFCSVAALLSENHFITTGTTPRVISVTTDPYQAQLSFGQFTRIKYVITRQASVTVKLISPAGIATVLLDGVVQPAGEYELEWTAADASDVTQKRFLLTEDGDYTVWVQASDPSSAASSVLRGSLNVGN